uniref:HECT-type E3 ubiquitin transferase n=1 Tax=Guillardia theta (strain CCMP2712) TaxID=905079 RepID=A0A0C3TDI4_GUITC
MLVEGFYSIIPEELLEPFDENELELMLCGTPEVSVEDLKRNTQYPRMTNPLGVPVIQWFWQCVENMSNEDRARLLQFVTGSSQVPSGGFQTLEPKFNVQLNFAPPSHLPVSHTCFNTIELPDYRSFEQLQDRLALALKEGAEGFGEA